MRAGVKVMLHWSTCNADSQRMFFARICRHVTLLNRFLKLPTRCSTANIAKNRSQRAVTIEWFFAQHHIIASWRGKLTSVTSPLRSWKVATKTRCRRPKINIFFWLPETKVPALAFWVNKTGIMPVYLPEYTCEGENHLNQTAPEKLAKIFRIWRVCSYAIRAVQSYNNATEPMKSTQENILLSSVMTMDICRCSEFTQRSPNLILFMQKSVLSIITYITWDRLDFLRTLKKKTCFRCAEKAPFAWAARKVQESWQGKSSGK